MTRIQTPDQYKCDKCGATEEAREGGGYPNGWGIYEHYPKGVADLKRSNGDLCPDCIKLVLPEEPKQTLETKHLRTNE